MKLAAGRGQYLRDVPHGLMFHRFHASVESDTWQGALTPEDFEAILLFAGPENILSPLEWMSRLEHGRLGGGDLCITFDDGLRCQAEYALPVLERYGLKAFWFVYSCVLEGIPVRSEVYSYVAGLAGGISSVTEELIERCPQELLAQFESEAFGAYARRMREVAPFYSASDIRYRFLRNRVENKDAFEHLMDGIVRERGFDVQTASRNLWLDAADLKALTERGHYVGLHSYDHPYELALLPVAAQREQYQRNAADIAAATNRKPTCMSHPLNSYDEQTLAVLEALGVRCGFRANTVAPAGKALNASRLELAREDSANVLLMVKRAVG